MQNRKDSKRSRPSPRPKSSRRAAVTKESGKIKTVATPSHELSGILDFVDPPNLFRLLAKVDATGLLELSSSGDKVDVYFLKGRLVFAEAASNKIKLGSLLVKKGLVSKERAQEALDTFAKEKGKRKLGEILVEEGYIAEEKIQNALMSQIKIAIYSTLLWKKGTFAFTRDLAPPSENLIFDVDVEQLTREVLSRAQEQDKG